MRQNLGPRKLLFSPYSYFMRCKMFLQFYTTQALSTQSLVLWLWLWLMKIPTHECVILLAMLKMMLKKALAREQWRLTTFLHFGDTMTPRSIFYLDRISYHGAKLSTFNNWLVPNCPVIDCLTILKYKSQNCTLFVLIQGFIYWSPFPVVHFSNLYNVESPCFNEL